MGDSNKTFYLLIGNSILHWLKANRDKNNTIHSSGTKNKAPLLIIQGTEFNYMENIKHFPNRKKISRKAGDELSSAFNAPTVPSAEAPQQCWVRAPAPNTAHNQASLLWDPFCQNWALTTPNSAKFLQDGMSHRQCSTAVSVHFAVRWQLIISKSAVVQTHPKSNIWGLNSSVSLTRSI